MKLSLKKILKEFGHSMPVSPGLRPTGPSGKNQHQFPHHGMYGKYGGYKPKTGDKGPYLDKDIDLVMGDEAAEMAEESLSLESFFKFTKSANDNTSAYRPPTYGRGAMAAYGKSSKEYGSYDPTVDEDNPREKKRRETVDGRAHQKVDVFEFAGPGLRDRHGRDENDYITQQPFASGLPGYDKKDITNGEAKIDELMRELEKEENSVNEGYADSDWSKMHYSKVSQTPVADLNFWDIIKRDNLYNMNGIDEFENAQKKQKK